MLEKGFRKVRSLGGTPLFKGKLTVFVSGFTMLMTQVVLLRELASLYSVNELIVGVFLSFWMLFAGSGAFAARFFRGFSWSGSGFFPLIAGFASFLALWVLYLAHIWLVPEGVSPGVIDWLLVTALVTFLFCFPSGMMFTWFSVALSNQAKQRKTEHVYIAEQIGSLLAGILFYLASSLWLNAFSVLTFLFIVNFLVALYLFYPVQSKVWQVVSIAGAACLILLLFVPQYQMGREMVHGNPVRQTFFSPYGSIDVTGEGENAEFFGQGRFFSGSLLASEREEYLHPALLLHPSPRRVLLVNSAPGLLSEALKYDSLSIDYVSPNSSRINLEKRLLKINQETSCDVSFVQTDPVRHLSRVDTKPYDVVLIGGGIPSNLASTRFYTRSFFDLVSRKLQSDGLMMTGGLSYMTSWTESRRSILQVLHQTVNEVFPDIRIWAGEKVFFIASKQEISANWWEQHPDVLTTNKFLREDFFPDYVLEEQTNEVKEIIQTEVPVNTRVQPELFRLGLADLGDFWDIKVHWFAIVLGGMFILGLLFFRGSAGGVFLAGFVLGGMQVVLLLLWQMVMGDLYRATGLLFSLFMAGLAVGALLGQRKILIFKARYFSVLLFVLAFMTIGAVPVLNGWGHVSIFPVMTSLAVFALAVAGGGVFVSGVGLYKGSIGHGAAMIYGADVAGGAIGSFLSAIFFVPYTGLVNTGFLMGLVVLIGGLLLLKKL
ncbi:MAG: spermine synthase [Marinilabilia sp.]